MASKGQKFNKYNEEIISEVLSELMTGKSSLQISRERNIPAKTIRGWKLKKFFIPRCILINGKNVAKKEKKI